MSKLPIAPGIGPVAFNNRKGVLTMIRKISFLGLVVGLALGSFLYPQPAFARQIQVNRTFKAPAPLVRDKRPDAKEESKKEADEPTGKYLVGEPISIQAAGALRHTFTLSLCSGATIRAECDKLDEPPNTSSIFHLKGTDESGQPMRISVKPVREADVYLYDNAIAGVKIRPTEPGKLVLEATASPNARQFARAGYSPVRVTLYVAGSSGSELSTCARLFPPVYQTPPVIDANMIVGLIGAPHPYFLEARGRDKILIYSTDPPQDDAKKVRKKILDSITQQIKHLSTFRPSDLGLEDKTQFKVELSVPHSAALDVRARVASLNNSRFTTTTVGSDRIQITSPEQPDCAAWTGYLANLQRLFWGISPESPTSRLFYQQAKDVSAVLAGPQTGQPSPPAAAAAPAPAAAAADPPGAAATTPKTDSPPAPKTKSTVTPLNEDLLVFNEPTPGDDADVIEKKRLIAQLDLPRPEMIVNAWVMQNSSKDATLVSGFSDTVARTVSAFNDALEASVTRAWSYLSERINPSNAYFEDQFYRYISRRYVGELPFPKGFPISASQGAQEVLEFRSNQKLTDEERDRHQACGADEYCLGYVALFQPLKPRLTDLLITVIAAKSPILEAAGAIRAIETTDPPRTRCDSRGSADYCEKVRTRLRIPDSALANLSEKEDCRFRDLVEIHKTARYDSSPILQLRCFKEKAASIFGTASGTRTQVGLLRSAIADFLFNYKMSQQYPHEFSPYDLSQSADTLNAALSPFIDAFNQDLKAFQEFLQEDLRYRVESLPGATGGFFRNKQNFLNNGIVSVRTISGQKAAVDTTSQSFMDASSLPQFADLAKSILDQKPEKGANGDPTGVLGNVSFNQAQVILGALEAFRPTTVQIGRSLNLTINPRSLSAASAAEIDVILTANESAEPTYFGGPKGAQPPNTSRVAKHDTTTRVRVDSLKLFEVSSFSAELQRSRSRFPLLPPFVEIPYIGTLIGIPLPPAKQYHTSTAVLSAIVVPTAADLAYGLNFITDRILDPNGLRKALSMRDLHQPIRTFNKEKTSCFASQQGQTAKCLRLSFNDILRDSGEK